MALLDPALGTYHFIARGHVGTPLLAAFGQSSILSLNHPSMCAMTEEALLPFQTKAASSVAKGDIYLLYIGGFADYVFSRMGKNNNNAFEYKDGLNRLLYKIEKCIKKAIGQACPLYSGPGLCAIRAESSSPGR